MSIRYNICGNGDLEGLKECLANGYTLDEFECHLDVACYWKHLEFVKYMCSIGAKLSLTCLSQACAGGNLELVKFIVDNLEDFNKNNVPLDFACTFGHLEVVKFLVEKGMKINEYVVDYPIYSACKHGYLDIVKYLVQNGGNPNIKNDSARFSAAFRGHISIYCYLSLFAREWYVTYDKSFESFYMVTTWFSNETKWSQNQEIKQDYLFDPNLCLIVASFAFA